MKLLTLILSFVIACPLLSDLVAANDDNASDGFPCVTFYAKSSVPVETVSIIRGFFDTVLKTTGTIYHPEVSTHYSTVHVTVQSTAIFTVYSTSAPTTTTIPTPSGFIPIKAAPSRFRTSNIKKGQRRRKVQPRRTRKDGVIPASRRGGRRLAGPNASNPQVTSAASYPGHVVCRSLFTETITYDYERDAISVTKVVSKTSKITATVTHVTHVTTTPTVTVHQKTATKYAACLPDSQNVANHFDGYPLKAHLGGALFRHFPCSSASSCVDDIAALQGPEECCHASWANGINGINSGFVFSGPAGSGASCAQMTNGYSFSFEVFSDREHPADLWLGNGMSTYGFFAGFSLLYGDYASYS